MPEKVCILKEKRKKTRGRAKNVLSIAHINSTIYSGIRYLITRPTNATFPPPYTVFFTLNTIYWDQLKPNLFGGFITLPDRVTRPGLDSPWLGSKSLVVAVSRFLHPESWLPSNSILSSTVGTEITSDLWNVSLLSSGGIYELELALTDDPGNLKMYFFLTHQFSTWKLMPLASTVIKWLISR